jgi:hypothetical protein
MKTVCGPAMITQAFCEIFNLVGNAATRDPVPRFGPGTLSHLFDTQKNPPAIASKPLQRRCSKHEVMAPAISPEPVTECLEWLTLTLTKLKP